MFGKVKCKRFEQNMAACDKICRVCASPAQYDIFSKIPAYLHAASNEFTNKLWQKPINILIEESTGLKVSQDDGLPKCICALCISYLKHAASFRDQVIKNALSLQTIKKLRDEKLKGANEKDSVLITEQELKASDNRKIDTNMLANSLRNDKDAKVSKCLFQPSVSAPSQDYVIQQMRYLNLLFDKEINSGIAEVERQHNAEELASNRPYVDPMADYETESTSNEENDGENFTNSTNLTERNIFSYTQKNFEEDDIMNLDELRDAINVNIPENCKERKCRACFRRFMFENSYEQHMENCIEYKFLQFIEEINLLLDIRRKKAVSPHEFIRRMIFSLRKICDFLKINCDEIMLPDELAINNEREMKTQCNNMAGEEPDNTVEDREEQRDSPVNFAATTNAAANCTENKDATTFNLLMKSPQQDQDLLLGTKTPISIHNNILYEIERAQSASNIYNDDDNKSKNINAQENHTVKLMRPIPMHAMPKAQTTLQQSLLSPVLVSDDERQTFIQKLEQLSVYETPKQKNSNQRPDVPTASISVRKDLMPKSNAVPATSPQSCSAACNLCNAVFETISDFELHNAMYHNGAEANSFHSASKRARRTSDEERERIIAMFENEDDM